MRGVTPAFTVLFALCCGVGAYPQQKKVATKIPPRAVTYSQVEFTGSIPPGYLGHDGKAIYKQLLRRRSELQKGEFETASAFQERVKADSGKPLYGSLTQYSLLAFVFAPANGDTSTGFTVQYDPDKQVLQAKLETWPTHTMSLNNDVALLWGVLDRSVEHYRASNAYGAIVTVERVFTEYVALSFAKQSSLRPFTFEVYVPPEKARALKGNVRILVTGRLSDPPLQDGFFKVPATISSPYEMLKAYHYLHLILGDVYLLDISNGEILKVWRE